MTKIERIIDDLVNGNLTDAKEQAKNLSRPKIKQFCLDFGWSENKAEAAANYLKGKITFQTYCDATVP